MTVAGRYKFGKTSQLCIREQFAFASNTNRFFVVAILVRDLDFATEESTTATQRKLQPALLRLSGMIY